jgi:hypothetical protein
MLIMIVVVMMVIFNVQRIATLYHASNIFVFISLDIYSYMYVETQDEVTQNE